MSHSTSPNVLRCLYDQSVSLFDAGILAGMNDARRGVDRAVYESHLKLINGMYGVSPISKSFSQGYVHGFSAVRYGVIA